MELLRVGAEEFRRKLSDLLNRVGYGKDRVVVERHGTPVAVLVPYEVYAAFEKFMDSRGELHLPTYSVEANLDALGAELAYADIDYDGLAARMREERVRSLREHFPEFYETYVREQDLAPEPTPSLS